MAEQMSLEDQKKLILPFLQRAQEIQAVDGKVAYYCRFHALQQILLLGSGTAPEIKSLAKPLLAQLEKERPKLDLISPDQDKEHCVAFALRIFKNADRVDCAGRASLDTCKAFYAASIFLQITAQFNERDPATGDYPLDTDLEQKARYAAWRAVELRKALKEGRPPLPPNSELLAPPGGDGDIFGGSAAAAAGGGGGGGGGLFSGPAYPSGEGYEEFAPDPAAAGAGGQDVGGRAAGSSASAPNPWQAPPPPATPGMDSIASDTDAFLDLPPPPTHEPALGGAGTAVSQPPALAASLGPRFHVGAKVVVLLPGGRLEPGTVGQVVSVAPPDPRYKVALREAILEVADSQCAADVGPGARVEVVEAAGGPPQGATVLDSRLDKWPAAYLLEKDGGGGVTDMWASHVRLAPTAAAAGGAPAGYAPPDHPSGGSALPPAAPPLVDPPTTSSPSVPPPPPAAAASAPGAPAPYGWPSPGQGQGVSAPPPGAAAGGPGSTRGGAAPPPAVHGRGASAAAPGSSSGGGGGGGSHYPSASAAAGKATAVPAVSLPAPTPGYTPSLAVIQEAHKAAKYAVSSLAFDDVSGGVKYLTDALRLLTQPSGK